jgi:hypothetical protein
VIEAGTTVDVAVGVARGARVGVELLVAAKVDVAVAVGSGVVVPATVSVGEAVRVIVATGAAVAVGVTVPVSVGGGVPPLHKPSAQSPPSKKMPPRPAQVTSLTGALQIGVVKRRSQHPRRLTVGVRVGVGVGVSVGG